MNPNVIKHEPQYNRCRWLNLILVYAVTSIVLMHTPACHAKENNIFVLQGLNSSFNPAMLDQTFVDGMALQIGWRDVEPAQGKYNWDRVDQFVNQAKSRNKRVTLHLLPLHPPEWIFSAGAEKFCFTMPARGDFMQGRQMCEVFPWDRVFLQRWSLLISEFGKHYNSSNTVLAVSVTAPTPEMVLPGAIPGTQTFFDMQKRYNKDIYLSAWEKMIDTYQQAFPDKAKFVAPGIVLFDENFADDVIGYARERFGSRLWLFNAGLRSDGVPQKTMGTGHIASLLETHAKTGVLGLQTIWSASDDPRNRMRGTLREALDKGAQMGASYFEIYAVDVLNSDLQSDVTAFKKRLAETH